MDGSWEACPVSDHTQIGRGQNSSPDGDSWVARMKRAGEMLPSATSPDPPMPSVSTGLLVAAPKDWLSHTHQSPFAPAGQGPGTWQGKGKVHCQ